MLPQNPQALFVKNPQCAQIYLEILPKSERKTERLAQVVSLCKLAELLDRHPYDLSGGEQQRAALAKILLLNPDILLLDEPTKGLDAEFKQVFGQILRTLQASGVAILMVSHDIEFCAKYADRCALFFDGNIVTEADTENVLFWQQLLHDGCEPHCARCAARCGHAGGRHCCLRRCGRTGGGFTGISAHPARAGERDADGEKAPGLAEASCRRVRCRCRWR